MAILSKTTDDQHFQFNNVNAEHRMDMSTDAAWEEWGRRDPYFGVITNPKFRRAELTEEARLEFFESGKTQVDYILNVIRKHINSSFSPKKVLDFGCGVGRLLVPFTSVAPEVFGLDVSPSMLKEARRNCDEQRAPHVRLLLSSDDLTALTETFDLIHSCIVFQHIPVQRGRAILARLLRHISPGGVGALQFTYSKVRFAETHGVPPPEKRRTRIAVPGASVTSTNHDPDIQMNSYNVNEILFLLQQGGVTHSYIEFTDHGGELGLYLFFQMPK
jgi:SAM-dependent methyltransferase